MKHGSLFSGIGGFDLASEWMGWDNVFNCEIEEFPRKILNYYWPNSISYENIKETDFTIHRGRIEILTGGFPCQPYSVAGKRKGTEDERHLWPEMLRAIREIQPRWIVGENVFGLVNWDAGLVFEQVQSDLEAEEYEVQAYVLPAAAVNAPHRRDRVWFVAYATDKYRTTRTNKRKECEPNNGSELWRNPSAISKERDVAHANNTRLQSRANNRIAERSRKERDKQPAGRFCANWEKFPTQSPICGGDDGLSSELDGITFPKWRNESIKGYGNAVVPQVVYQIFKAIQEYENTREI